MSDASKEADVLSTIAENDITAVLQLLLVVDNHKPMTVGSETNGKSS